MGAHYSFRCRKCCHEAEVSGGEDFGYVTKTKTMLCLACRDLVDVVTETRSASTVGDIGLCPRCHGSTLADWDAKSRPCPRCGGTMEKGELAALWD